MEQILFGNRSKDFMLEKILKYINQEERRHENLIEEVKALKSSLEVETNKNSELIRKYRKVPKE